ncbi:MAG: thiol-disulfide oxidoreductase DCC family protein [Planctomycetota bacterium]|jgi:predicted DCC family thiol-disulfide oxidoreductase YuxK
MSDHGPIILFDGVCNLCNRSVQFVIRRDHGPAFRFATLQSERGRGLMTARGLDPDSLESMVLIEDDRAFTRSDAALRIARRLARPWRWLWAFRVVPRGARDFIYGLVARHRYRWFGRRDACMVPSDDLRDRFLD